MSCFVILVCIINKGSCINGQVLWNTFYRAYLNTNKITISSSRYTRKYIVVVGGGGGGRVVTHSASFIRLIFVMNTVCFLKTVPSATCVLRDRQIVFIKRVYTEGNVFMNKLYVPKITSINFKIKMCYNRILFSIPPFSSSFIIFFFSI